MLPNNNNSSNNPSNRPSNVKPAKIQDLSHKPSHMKHPGDMGIPSAYNYRGPQGSYGLRGGPDNDTNTNHAGSPFRDDFNPRSYPSNHSTNVEPPSFEGPPMHNQRFRDDRGPGVPLYSSPRNNDILQGGNLVGPGQLQNINTQEAQHMRGDPSGRIKPRFDPIGPFPGFGEPDNDHMGKPGPKGFGPGDMY